jgi:hypothetical protein
MGDGNPPIRAWVIIGSLVSLLRPRLAATLGALWFLLNGILAVQAGTLPDSTWVALAPLPRQGSAAIFALAVDPANNQSVLAGMATGSLLRSTDGGTSWTSVYNGTSALTTIAYSPFKAGLVLAGTQHAGALESTDGGATWSTSTGLDGRAVRAFGFALTLFVAGTDKGLYLSDDGAAWTPSGLVGTSIDSLAVEAVHTPVRLVAGIDSPGQGGLLTLTQSTDSGATWTQFNPPVSGTLAVKMAAGPLPPTGNVRPLLVGTNGGLFQSTDNGSSFVPLSGGDLLPSIDYSQLAFITDHHDRFYAASDGGGSGSGGLWRSDDGGVTFASLLPPVPSVTALAVSNDDEPTLYVATFRPSDHLAELWAYHDTGGPPQEPAPSPASVPSSARTSSPGSGTWLLDIVRSPQFPYQMIGAAAMVVILAAAVAHFRGRHR